VSSEATRRLVLRTLMPGFVGTEIPGWLDEALVEGLASVALYGSNVESPEQVTDLVHDLRSRSPRLLVAVDEEGGDVTRLHYRTGSPYPGNAVLGRLDDVEVTRAEAARIGADLRAAGIDLDLAPSLDVNSAADNPVIGTRSFGADPLLVARQGAAWVDGLQSAGVLACVKHFPGHGATTTDSHHALPVVDEPADVVRTRELVPFAGTAAACAMVAHVVVPALDPDGPATFSRRIVTDLLRGELGFDGAVISDALDMAGASGAIGIPEAAVRALIAGCDLLCLGSQTDGPQLAAIVDAVLDAIGSGRLERSRLVDAASRVDELRARELVAAEIPSAPTDAVRAFEVSAEARAWLGRGGAVAVLQVSTDANLAVGQVPWGPAAVDGADASEGDAPRVAVVGRNLVAGHPAWALAEKLRADGRVVVVVDCGWPRGGAGIVTWGGSPAVSRPLVDLLHGRVAL
jgi:beta-N-acetylhexosaminidase